MKPSIGRIVHYVSYGTPGGEYTQQCRAAIVTQVGKGGRTLIRNGAGQVIASAWDEDVDVVDLAILNPSGFFFNTEIPYEQTGTKGGTWHWPEREEE